MIIRTHAYARAGLVGNPSDGYFGKTISITVRNYAAQVVLYESPELTIEACAEDLCRFSSIDELARDVRLHGYYGGMRLVKATIRRFGDYCRAHSIPLEPKNFTIRYSSTIPRLVGMAGSSAIVTATLRALMTFYGVPIAKTIQPSLILSVEKEELGIEAGLQDRVIQVYEGVVFMDFNLGLIRKQGHGEYRNLEPALLPPLYMAFDRLSAESSERVHNPIRVRFEQGDPAVVNAMKQFASLAEQVRDAIASGKGREIGPLLNANYDLRTTIMDISSRNRTMVQVARATGASAKFAGSGGAIIGTYPDESVFGVLCEKLGALGCEVFKPEIV
ncbi:MAG: GHMP kinase [Kiritimatiellia bacterium]